MFGKNILNETFLGSLTKTAVKNSIKASIDNVMDDFVKQAISSGTKSSKSTAEFVLKNIATEGAQGALKVAATANKVYDDVAKKAFGQSYQSLDKNLKQTVKNQVRTAVGELDDVVKSDAKKQLDDLLKGGKNVIDDASKGGLDDAGKKIQDDLTRNAGKPKSWWKEKFKKWGWMTPDGKLTPKGKWRMGLIAGTAFVAWFVSGDDSDPSPKPNPNPSPNPNPYPNPKPKPKPVFTKCTDFPYTKGCDSSVVAEVQKCLGISADGKFGSKTEKALTDGGYGTEITKEVYDKIKEKCGSSSNTNTDNTTVDPNKVTASDVTYTDVSYGDL